MPAPLPMSGCVCTGRWEQPRRWQFVLPWNGVRHQKLSIKIQIQRCQWGLLVCSSKLSCKCTEKQHYQVNPWGNQHLLPALLSAPPSLLARQERHVRAFLQPVALVLFSFEVISEWQHLDRECKGDQAEGTPLPCQCLCWDGVWAWGHSPACAATCVRTQRLEMSTQGSRWNMECSWGHPQVLHWPLCSHLSNHSDTFSERSISTPHWGPAPMEMAVWLKTDSEFQGPASASPCMKCQHTFSNKHSSNYEELNSSINDVELLYKVTSFSPTVQFWCVQVCWDKAHFFHMSWYGTHDVKPKKSQATEDKCLKIMHRVSGVAVFTHISSSAIFSLLFFSLGHTFM